MPDTGREPGGEATTLGFDRRVRAFLFVAGGALGLALGLGLPYLAGLWRISSGSRSVVCFATSVLTTRSGRGSRVHSSGWPSA